MLLIELKRWIQWLIFGFNQSEMVNNTMNLWLDQLDHFSKIDVGCCFSSSAQFNVKIADLFIVLIPLNQSRNLILDWYRSFIRFALVCSCLNEPKCYWLNLNVEFSGWCLVLTSQKWLITHWIFFELANWFLFSIDIGYCFSSSAQFDVLILNLFIEFI